MFNARPTKPLNNTPDTLAFFERATIPTGRKVMLGDASKLPQLAMNHINRAHEALENGINKVGALHYDETRTEVSKHIVGKKIAYDVCNVIEKAQAGLTALASELNDEGFNKIETAFALDEKRTPIHADIRGFIRELSKKETGLKEIRDMAGKNLEFASVLYGTPHYLLGLSEDTYNSINLDLVKKHCPEGAGCFAGSIELQKVAGKYPTIIKAVHRSFYNSGLADKGNSRVEH
ncbi:MAG: hypothetical protein ACXIVO_01200 [Glycocaulis sp.]